MSAAGGQDNRGGLLAATAAYGLWGLLPIFFRLLHHVGSFELVAQRVIWSLALVIGLLTARRSLGPLRAAIGNSRVLLALIVSGLLIGINWTTYVWAVNAGHIVAASLGYFLNPLVSVGLGVMVLKERLRPGQMAAIAVAAIGVAIMAATALTTLWISILLAFSFAFYALVRKMTPVAPMVGLGAETLVLTPLALVYLLWLGGHGSIAFGKDGITTLLIIASGAVTTVPLVLFTTAAQRLPMATLGLLQYIAPTLQFLCGVLLYGEKLNQGQMMSFALIWAGLIIFAFDSYGSARRARMALAA